MAFFVFNLIGLFWCEELTAPCSDGALRLFTERLEVLTLGCKLDWPHTSPEGSFDLPSLAFSYNSFLFSLY
jgi:hypothetical protein